MKKLFWPILVSILAASLFACGSKPETIPETASSAIVIPASVPFTDKDDSEKSWPFTEENDWNSRPDTQIEFTDENGRTTFLTKGLSEAVIQTAEDAKEYASSFLETQPVLEGSSLIYSGTHRFGNLVNYVFEQGFDDLILYGGIFKVITDLEGKPLAIANSFIQDGDELIDADKEDAGIPDPFASYPEQNFERSIYNVSVSGTLEDEIAVSVPIVTDPETGNQYLIDPERKIICADSENEESYSPVCLQTGKYLESKLITYSYFIQVYDYFAEKGWPAPDGLGTACRVLFDNSGESDGNASFNGFWDGFFNFSFGTNDEASQSLSVMAHEFMHGVSNVNNIGPYMNETGALDEAFSDSIGDAVASDLEGIGFQDNTFFSSRRTGHDQEAPLYIWDEYFHPKADLLTSANDSGAVHHNSFPVSLISYRLGEAGMEAADRFRFWMTMDLTLSPKTGFSELAARLPWVAEISGFPEYASVVSQAARLLKLNDLSLPETLPDHQIMVRLSLPASEHYAYTPVTLRCYMAAADYDFATYPIDQTGKIVAVLPAGSYSYQLEVGEESEEDSEETSMEHYFWNGSQWISFQADGEDEVLPDSFTPAVITTEGGQILDLSASGLPE